MAWLIAFVLGAGVVRVLASWTGFVDTNTFLDLMLDHSFSTYWRLLVIVPIWAFFATAFATAFIEAPDWWARRTLPPAAKPVIGRRVPAAVPPRADAGKKPARATTRASSTRPVPPVPRRVPSRPEPAVESGSPRASESRTREAVPPVGARTPDAEPSSDQRPRRIPRRDTAS